VIRFTYRLPDDLDPPELHRHLVREGAKPSLYSYRPRNDVWTLTTSDSDEAETIRKVLDKLGIEFEEQEVEARFSEQPYSLEECRLICDKINGVANSIRWGETNQETSLSI